jgi:ATP-dependent helicase HrpB
MSTGGSAQLSQSSAVDERFLVAVEAEERNDGKGRKIQVRIASGIDENWLLDLFPDAISEQTEAIWNDKSERVEWTERLVYRQLVLDEIRSSGRGKAQAAEVLYKAVVAKGVHNFFGEGQLEQYLARLEFAAQQGNGNSGEAEVQSVLEQTLREACSECLTFEEIRKANIFEMLKSKAQALTKGRLETTAPERVMLAGGRWVKVNYETGKVPWIESRLQDFFGMKKGPHIADNRVAVVIHLLAPNHRAVQVTSDLAGFWERHYPSIRKELMRKYPRHMWPEQGQTAAPPPPGKIRPPST